MSTTLSVGRKRGADPNRLTAKQRKFADEWMANGFRNRAAAVAAGYSNPSVSAVKCLRHPVVRAYLEKQLTEIHEQDRIRRYQLLDKIRRLNDFNLMDAVASTTKDGFLEFSEEEYRRVADEIGDCVTEVELVTKVTLVEDEVTGEQIELPTTKVRIKLMDKDRMFDRELKYHGILNLDDRVSVSLGVDLNGLLEGAEEERGVIDSNVIEGDLK